MGFDGVDGIDGGDIAAGPGGTPVRDTVLYFASSGSDGRVDFDTGPVTVDLTKGAGLNQADSSGPDTLSGIEDVVGSTADDVLIGDSRPIPSRAMPAMTTSSAAGAMTRSPGTRETTSCGGGRGGMTSCTTSSIRR